MRTEEHGPMAGHNRCTCVCHATLTCTSWCQATFTCTSGCQATRTSALLRTRPFPANQSALQMNCRAFPTQATTGGIVNTRPALHCGLPHGRLQPNSIVAAAEGHVTERGTSDFRQRVRWNIERPVVAPLGEAMAEPEFRHVPTSQLPANAFVLRCFRPLG